MINLHERMLPTSAGVEPATSWSPVGRRIQLSHRGGLGFFLAGGGYRGCWCVCVVGVCVVVLYKIMQNSLTVRSTSWNFIFLNKFQIIKQEAHGPRVAHLSDIATADTQMLCNIFPILSSQLIKRSSFKQFFILKKIYGMPVN